MKPENRPAPTRTDKRSLPDGWRKVQLSDVCQLVGDNINPLSLPDETFAHYSIPAFDNGETPVFEPGSSILSNKVLFPNNSVLFSKLNPRISRVWFVNDSHENRRICSTEFLPLLPDENHIRHDYLSLLLQSPSLIGKLRQKTAAATKSRERIKPNSVMESMITLPTLDEQKRIAKRLNEELSAVESARKAAEEQLELLVWRRARKGKSRQTTTAI